MALDLLWLCAWAGFSRRDAAALCVAGVALGAIHLRFAWQAWHLWHMVTSTFVLRGRLAHGDIDRGCAWQVCHLWHWTGSAAGFSRRDATALCVAGVALGDIHLRFAWQAWHLWPLVTYTFVSLGKRGTW